jgi:hypothetical protein
MATKSNTKSPTYSHSSHKSLPTLSLSRQKSTSIKISSVTVPTATVVADEFTVFTIHVVEKRFKRSIGNESELYDTPSHQGGDTWTVMKRYSSLRGFHRQLRKSFVHTRNTKPTTTNEPNAEEFQIPLPAFPPTKWFGNRAPKFVEDRRHALSVYFHLLIQWSKVGQTADLRMRLLREYLTFSDPEIAAHRMFQGMQHGPGLNRQGGEESESESDDGSVKQSSGSGSGSGSGNGGEEWEDSADIAAPPLSQSL